MNQKEKQALELFFKGIPQGSELLFVVSPLGEMVSPCWGIHLLQAACRSRGITAQVLYSNLVYAKTIGIECFSRLVYDDMFFMGERVFAAAAFGYPSLGRFMGNVSQPHWAPDYIWPGSRNRSRSTSPTIPESVTSVKEDLQAVDWEHLESLTTDWTTAAARQIANLGFSIVGCSTSFGGLIPSIAVLHCVKQVSPHIITVLGGVLCEGELAEGILSLNAGIDYVFSGEGELTFPELVKKLLEGHLPKERIIGGEVVKNLDTNLLPDYHEYFEQMKKLYPDREGSSFGSSLSIPYETSRGCWYGKCTFCGLNGQENIYRAKSPDKILQDLNELVHRYSIDNVTITMTDHTLPGEYFDTLLPRLAEEIPSLHISCEMRSNLKLSQVLALKKAGIREIRTGIESLSPSLLKKMQKGVTVRENMAFLRYIRLLNLKVSWLLLYGFPADEVGEYEEMLRLLPLIRHLPPPVMMVPLLLCRFSEYQRSPGAFQLTNLRPGDFYNDVLPVHADMEKIAYYFTADFTAQSHEKPEIISALWQEFQAWRSAWKPYEILHMDMLIPTLHITQKTEDEYILVDTRGLEGRPERMVLNRDQTRTLLVPKQQDSSNDYQWAVDAQLGVLMESWFIPLATAEPELLQEFEGENR